MKKWIAETIEFNVAIDMGLIALAPTEKLQKEYIFIEMSTFVDAFLKHCKKIKITEPLYITGRMMVKA